jgi:hypothetical protein
VDILEWQIAVPGTAARRSPPVMGSFDQGGGEASKAPRKEAQSPSSATALYLLVNMAREGSPRSVMASVTSLN